MDQDLYHRALSAVIAAAYRVLETWEEGNLAGRVTALGEIARHWDQALGLGVVGRRSERDEQDEQDEQDERDTDGEGAEDTAGRVPASVSAWATRWWPRCA